MTYTLRPDIQFEVKSAARSASKINVLWYGVYHKNADGLYVYMRDMSAYVEIVDTSDIKVPIALFKDQEYRLVFVAQHCIQSAQRSLSYVYTVTENGLMSVNHTAPITSGEQLEAFVYVDEVGPINGNESRDMTLSRIVSQVNIGTSADVLPNNLNITVSGVPAAYDIFNGIFSEDKIDLEFEGIGVSRETMNVNSTDYTKLATLYLLGSNRISLTVSDSSDTGKSTTISNVETKVNYKTNIAGNILHE